MNTQCAVVLREIVTSTPPKHWLDANDLRKQLLTRCKGLGLESETDMIVKVLEAGLPQSLLRAGESGAASSVEDFCRNYDTAASLKEQQSFRWAATVWAYSLGLIPSVDVAESSSADAVFASAPVAEQVTNSNELVEYVLTDSGELERREANSKDRKASVVPSGSGIPRKQRKKVRDKASPISFGLIKGWIALFLFGVAIVSLAMSGKVEKYQIHCWIAAGICAVVGIWLILISTCPRCKSTNINVASRDRINSHYLHPRKDGQADRRYNYNPLVCTYLVNRRCAECSNRWQTRETVNE